LIVTEYSYILSLNTWNFCVQCL